MERVATGEHATPGWRAPLVCVVTLQQDTRLLQLLHAWRKWDRAVLDRSIGPTEIVEQKGYEVWALG
jgi:hypothetical protein